MLIAVFGLSTVSTIVSWWADDAMYDPAIMVAAFGDLPDDPVQADKMGAWLAAETVDGLDVEGLLAETLPLGLSLFSGPLADGVERAAATASSRMIQTEFFAGIWEDALPLAHSGLIAAIEGSDEGVLRVEDDVVSVDISQAILATYEQLMLLLPDIAENDLVAGITGLEPGDLENAVDGWVLQNLPSDLGAFVLLESDSLAAVQGWKARVGQIVWLSALATLLAAVAALLISPRPRRALLALVLTAFAAIAIGIIAVGGAERAVISALANLPLDGEGFDPGAMLDAWWLLMIALILVAAIMAVAGWTLRWRAAGESRQSTSQSGR